MYTRDRKPCYGHYCNISAGTKGHSHPHKEEHYYILKGSGSILLDKVKYEIHTGDDVYIVPVSVHTVINPNDEPLEFFCAATPGEPKNLAGED